ncbi:phosphatase domain-containing protein [uncultured Sunxiuqinia sp.]|uniref:App1 family protein n=1 Tax=uncultured Sunxiuqinia sp. TaxID=1573825 RepID=UPI002AA8FAC2|nr:phosphatase domain-containing protein [uncultured Sunxiuqinia sp.]
MVKGVKPFIYFKRKTKSISKRIKLYLKHRLGWLGIPVIVAYRGFGNSSQLFVNGYVTEDKGLAKTLETNSVWMNMLSMIKRYSSDEIPGVDVKIEIDEKFHHVTTEDNGLFKTSFTNSSHAIRSNSEWLPYVATLYSDITGEDQEVSAKGELFIPGNDLDFGVISDIDDTILISHATQTLRKLRLMLWRNARTRKPFPGVAAFYRALHSGVNGKKANPFFYVSSSEWNLYDLLEDFCRFNNFPKGVFLLRELKMNILKFWKSGGGNHEHKYEKIRMLFETYPTMSFILIGDNGQHDPEIYNRITSEFPNRVKAIYIRTIKKKRINKRLNEIIDGLRNQNVPMILAKDTVDAARHAAQCHYISSADIDQIILDTKEDLAKPEEPLMKKGSS